MSIPARVVRTLLTVLNVVAQLRSEVGTRLSQPIFTEVFFSFLLLFVLSRILVGRSRLVEHVGVHQFSIQTQLTGLMCKDAHLSIVAHFLTAQIKTWAELSTVVLENIVTFKRLHVLIQDVGYHLRMWIHLQLVPVFVITHLLGIIFERRVSIRK